MLSCVDLLLKTRTDCVQRTSHSCGGALDEEDRNGAKRDRSDDLGSELFIVHDEPFCCGFTKKTN